MRSSCHCRRSSDFRKTYFFEIHEREKGHSAFALHGCDAFKLIRLWKMDRRRPDIGARCDGQSIVKRSRLRDCHYVVYMSLYRCLSSSNPILNNQSLSSLAPSYGTVAAFLFQRTTKTTTNTPSQTGKFAVCPWVQRSLDFCFLLLSFSVSVLLATDATSDAITIASRQTSTCCAFAFATAFALIDTASCTSSFRFAAGS